MLRTGSPQKILSRNKLDGEPKPVRGEQRARVIAVVLHPRDSTMVAIPENKQE